MLTWIQWHPTRPYVAATGVESGKIYIWGINTPQRWSALAPDFLEVEENVEYIEQEDEFDIHPLDELKKRRLDQEDEEVDVLTVDPMQLEREGGANPGGIFRMPVLIGIDDSDSEDEMVAIGAGQFRRKSTAREESELLEGDDLETDSLQGEPNGHTGSKRRRGDWAAQWQRSSNPPLSIFFHQIQTIGTIIAMATATPQVLDLMNALANASEEHVEETIKELSRHCRSAWRPALKPPRWEFGFEKERPEQEHRMEEEAWSAITP
jgi:hypothetical protein